MEFHYADLDLKPALESILEKYNGFIEVNAGKYSDSSKEIVIRMEEQEESYRISVINSGQPISQDVRDYIWDGFYKSDEARMNCEGSYGLVLSIVCAIQEMSGQAYGCYNKENKVIFWFDVMKSNQN